MRADTDRDGRVTHDEFWLWLRGRLDRRDRDRDGAVTLQELDLRGARAAATFRGMDADRDGKLTPDELRPASEMWFRALDVDRDGALAPREAPGRRPRPPANASPTAPG